MKAETTIKVSLGVLGFSFVKSVMQEA